MKSEFRESFLRDVRKLKDRRLSEMIEGVIGEVETAARPSDVPGLQKLKGHSIALRPTEYLTAASCNLASQLHGPAKRMQLPRMEARLSLSHLLTFSLSHCHRLTRIV